MDRPITAPPRGPRLQVCPRCDYSLMGLPDVGVCPECGRTYDRTAIYLYGNALGARRSAWNGRVDRRRPVRMVLSQLGVIAWLGWWFFIQRGMPIHDPFPYIWIAVVSISWIIAFWRGFSDQGSGVVQVKLTPQGVHQCTRGIGPYPYERNETATLTPWNRVKSVTFKCAADGVGELRLSNRESFWRVRLDRDYVHANFRASADDIIAIRRCVFDWLVKHDCRRAIELLERDASSAALPGDSWRELSLTRTGEGVEDRTIAA